MEFPLSVRHGLLSVDHAALEACIGLGRCLVVEAGLVRAPVVEGFDVIEQDRAELAAGELGPVAVDVADLSFECRPCRFHRGVIETIAGRSEKSRSKELLH